jgi:hypothetical protein
VNETGAGVGVGAGVAGGGTGVGQDGCPQPTVMIATSGTRGAPNRRAMRLIMASTVLSLPLSICPRGPKVKSDPPM